MQICGCYAARTSRLKSSVRAEFSAARVDAKSACTAKPKQHQHSIVSQNKHMIQAVAELHQLQHLWEAGGHADRAPAALHLAATRMPRV